MVLFDQTINRWLDSVFVKGKKFTYKTNVVSDTALEPGQISPYTLPLKSKKAKSGVSHNEYKWEQTR